jgi:hypothetical protein
MAGWANRAQEQHDALSVDQKRLIHELVHFDASATTRCGREEFSPDATSLLVEYDQLGDKLKVALEADTTAMHNATREPHDIHQYARGIEARTRSRIELEILKVWKLRAQIAFILAQNECLASEFLRRVPAKPGDSDQARSREAVGEIKRFVTEMQDSESSRVKSLTDMLTNTVSYPDN